MTPNDHVISSEEISRRLEAKKRGETFSEVKKTPPPSSSNNCPECQTPNPDSAKFCVGCGASLSKEITPTTGESTATPVEIPVTTPVSTPETAPAEDYKLCPSCNQKNKLDAKFCIICGHKFEEKDAGQKPLEPLVDMVAEKEAPITETPETETPQESVIPEIKVPEQFTPEDKPVEEPPAEIAEVESKEETAPAEIAEVESKEETAPAEIIPEVQPAAVKTEEIPETKQTTEPAEDPVLKIKKAKELLDIGAITQEEFDRIKNKYLELI
ncbi:MAG: zinc ribbon domain-containing protein [Methanobacterium sp.]|nr:zinc ribbon domain-containing protein [Methanobacterium sp.]